MSIPAQSNQKAQVQKRMAQVVGQTVLIALLLLGSAGRLDWSWAWIYIGFGVVVVAINALVLPRELIAERGQPRENVKPWDRKIASLLVVPTLAFFIVAGLDKRFAWSPALPLWLHLLGLALAAFGQGLFTWAMVSNRFFSPAVRLQTDREHQVAIGGPYRHVRHPGYAGLILTFVGTSLLLGSLWSLVPALVIAVLYIVRTALEDRTLQQELEGYAAYAQRVRARLLPGVW